MGTYSPANVIEPPRVAAQEDDKENLELSQPYSIITFPADEINHSIPVKSYRLRLAFTTVTKDPFKTFFCHTYQPFVILFTFLHAALQYGSTLAGFSILETYFAAPP
jgi:hypothetical protein